MSDFKAISILTEQIKATGLTTLSRNQLTPTTGHLIWNSDDLEFQYYDGKQWIAVANTNTTTDNMIDTFTVPSIGGTYLIPLAIGGIESTLNQSIAIDGQPYQVLFENLLYPVQNPTFTNPFLTLSQNGADLYEVGQVISKNFSSVFDRGNINTTYTHQNANGVVQSTLYSGLPNSYILKDLDYITTLQTANTSSLSYNFSSQTCTVIEDLNEYTVITSYNIGNQPYNSRGQTYGNPLPAGNVESYISFYGTYPNFTNNTDVLVPVTKLSLSYLKQAITFTISFNEGTNKHTFDISDDYGSVMEIQAYNTVAGIYQALDIASFTTSTVTHTVQGNVLNYTRYTNNGPNRGSTQYKVLFWPNQGEG